MSMRRCHVLPWEVDRDHVGAPAQQRLVRSHLGAGAHHDDGAPAEVEPVGVLVDEAERGDRGRLGGARVGPPVEQPQQVGPADRSLVVVEHEAGVARAVRCPRW